jgi:hypothetical protein
MRRAPPIADRINPTDFQRHGGAAVESCCSAIGSVQNCGGIKGAFKESGDEELVKVLLLTWRTQRSKPPAGRQNARAAATRSAAYSIVAITRAGSDTQT